MTFWFCRMSTGGTSMAAWRVTQALCSTRLSASRPSPRQAYRKGHHLWHQHGRLPRNQSRALARRRPAICVGGDFCRHPPRLSNPKDEIRAFDLICACRPAGDTDVLAVFAAGNRDDAENYAVLRWVLPDCVPIPVDTTTHNVPTLDELRAGGLPLSSRCCSPLSVTFPVRPVGGYLRRKETCRSIS